MPKSNVPGHAGRAKHPDDCKGCWECCTKCAYDTHECRACGVTTDHGQLWCAGHESHNEGYL